MSVILNYPGVCNLFDFSLSLWKTFVFLTVRGASVGELSWGPCLQKHVSLFESLIFIFQHADVLWLHFWKLAALGRILWPVLQFLLWVCQSSPDSGRVSPVGSWYLFFFCLLHRGFRHRASGHGLHYSFCIYDGTQSQSVFQVLGNLSSAAFQTGTSILFFTCFQW